MRCWGKAGTFSLSVFVHILALLAIRQPFFQPLSRPLGDEGPYLIVNLAVGAPAKAPAAGNTKALAFHRPAFASLTKSPDPGVSFNESRYPSLQEENSPLYKVDKLVWSEMEGEALKESQEAWGPIAERIALHTPSLLRGRKTAHLFNSHRVSSAFQSLPITKKVFDYADKIGGLRGYYMNQILTKIETAKRYPRRARNWGIEGIAYLKFRLTQSGEVDDVVLVASSGSKILDQASVETILKASPFPYIGGWIKVNISYNLEE